MHGFLIDLARLVDLQFGRAHLFHHRQADIAHGEDIGSGQVGQHVGVHMFFFQRQFVMIVVDILRHVDIQRRPVVLVGVQEIIPGPGVLERGQLVDVGHTIDNTLVVRIDRAGIIGLGRNILWRIHPRQRGRFTLNANIWLAFKTGCARLTRR